jgi:hypothetical protein
MSRSRVERRTMDNAIEESRIWCGRVRARVEKEMLERGDLCSD